MLLVCGLRKFFDFVDDLTYRGLQRHLASEEGSGLSRKNQGSAKCSAVDGSMNARPHPQQASSHRHGAQRNGAGQPSDLGNAHLSPCLGPGQSNIELQTKNDDSGYMDGSAVIDAESEGDVPNDSSFAQASGSSFIDEGIANTVATVKSEGPIGDCFSSDTQSAMTNEASKADPPVLIRMRDSSGAMRTIDQEDFRKLPVEVAAFCHITLYDADWRKLPRRKEQRARAAANVALDLAYTRDKHGRRPGLAAMFGTGWDKEAVFKVWKDLKRRVPKADPLDRVLNWVLSDDVRSYAPEDISDYETSFLDLPERGKHFPNPNPAWSVPVLEGYETSISRCASERGTHGHNSPVPVDPHGKEILRIHKELQQRQVDMKDQIERGVVTAETLEQEQGSGDLDQGDDENLSELVDRLDHHLALRRACRTLYAVDQMNHELAKNHARVVPGHRHYQAGFNYGQQQQQYAHQMVATQANHHVQQQQQQQQPAAAKPYPVHIAKPVPFPSHGAAAAENNPWNGIYLPQMPQPNYPVDTRRTHAQATANGLAVAHDGQPLHAANLRPLKNTRRHKKSGFAPPRPTLNRSGSYYTMPYQCLWQRCGLRFKTSQELYTHVERQHILTDPGLLTGERGFSCQWHGCSIHENGLLGQLTSQSTANLAGLGTSKGHSKGRVGNGNTYPAARQKPHSFKARYQLLIHLQNVHCKDKMKFDDQLASVKDKHIWSSNQATTSDHLSDIAETYPKPPQPAPHR